MFNECIYTIKILVKEDYIMLLKIIRFIENTFKKKTTKNMF